MKVELVELDLAPVVATFGRRLREAGLPTTPEHASSDQCCDVQTKQGATAPDAHAVSWQTPSGPSGR